MRRNTLLLMIAIFILASACAWAVPTVSNVSASQRGDGSRLVDVSYDLAETLGDWPYVTLKISTDGGTTYSVTANTVTGDCKRNVAPGAGKHIVWDAKTDMPDVSGNNFKAQVNASTCIGYASPMIIVPAHNRDVDPGFVRGTDGGVCKFANNGPAQNLTLAAYQIGKYEVTRAEYAKFMETGGYSTQSCWSTDGWTWKTANSRTQPDYWVSQQDWGDPPGQFTQTGRHPVVGVTYYEAEAYCNWANQYIAAGDAPYHLATEAQWENAARANLQPVFPWGDTWDHQKLNNISDTAFPGKQTSPVGSFPSGASPYGCMDMGGNVQEWCGDWYSATYYAEGPLVDPPGPASGTDRIVRGGSFEHTSPPTDCHLVTYVRVGLAPTYAANDLGFRLAR